MEETAFRYGGRVAANILNKSCGQSTVGIVQGLRTSGRKKLAYY
jgi:hypothetical protein